jgi:thioredoxin-like negative regulator of GroEL
MTVEFYTQKSCAPCRIVRPIIEAICNETSTKLVIVDIIAEKERTTKAGVWATPTTIILNANGQEVARLNTKTEVEQQLKSLLKLPNTEGVKQPEATAKKVVVGGLVALLIASIFSNSK